MLSKEAYEAGQKAQVSPLDLMECLQDRPVEPSKAVQGKCVAQAEKQEPVKDEPVFEVGFGWLQDADKFGRGTKLYPRPQPDLTAEVERLKAECDSFCMNYRMKCDLETKQQAERIAELEEAAREVMGSLHSINLCSVNSMSSRNEMQRLNNEAILTLDAVLGNAEITGG